MADKTENTINETLSIPDKNIVLIGMPTSGKSTVGVILAKVLGMDFVDTDIIIQQKEGLKLNKIIEEKGEEGFLKTEEKALLDLECENTVIATGGSAVYSRSAMEHLKQISTVVYLRIEPTELKKRLKDTKERGVILRPGESIDEMFRSRAVLYEKYADITVSENSKTIEDTVRMICDRV
ncbi:MAG: shikimate kinase [Lachnospiraceae bacterium]|nr:shikimate kinase [Lachnospiraceae bacterium]